MPTYRSLLVKSPAATSDATLPIALADSMLNAGSLFCLDFARIGCWDPATDTLADGATVRNLVTGAPNALLKIPASGDLTFVTDKGFQLRATSALGRVQIGAGTDYFQTNLTNDYLIIVWATYPAVVPTSDVGWLITKATANAYTNVGPWLAARFSGSGGMFGRMDAVTASNGLGAASLGSPAGKHQFAIAKVGTTQLLFRDGVLVSTTTRGTPDLTVNSNTLCFGNGAGTGQFACEGTILHRAYAENLTVSGLTAQARVTADYGFNSSRF